MRNPDGHYFVHFFVCLLIVSFIISLPNFSRRFCTSTHAQSSRGGGGGRGGTSFTLCFLLDRKCERKKKICFILGGGRLWRCDGGNRRSLVSAAHAGKTQTRVDVNILNLTFNNPRIYRGTKTFFF